MCNLLTDKEKNLLKEINSSSQPVTMADIKASTSLNEKDIEKLISDGCLTQGLRTAKDKQMPVNGLEVTVEGKLAAGLV